MILKNEKEWTKQIIGEKPFQAEETAGVRLQDEKEWGLVQEDKEVSVACNRLS